MLRLIWIFGIVLALASCGDKVSEANSEITLEKPTYLIPEDKMIQVLADVHLLEGAVGFNVPRPPSMIPDVNDPAMIRQIPAVSQQQSIPYYDIFKEHSCTRDQFERSLQWYSMDLHNSHSCTMK